MTFLGEGVRLVLCALRAIANNTFGLDKETLIKVYKHFIRPVWEYACTVQPGHRTCPLGYTLQNFAHYPKQDRG